jgi:hypothetical protein
MRALLLVVAAIFALNVAYGSFLFLSEFVQRRRARREVGALEAMWRADRNDTDRRATRSVGRMVLAGASLLLVSALTATSPTAREVVSRVTEAIGGLGGDRGVEAAASGTAPTTSAELAPTVTPTTSAGPSGSARQPGDDVTASELGLPDPAERVAPSDSSVTQRTDGPPAVSPSPIVGEPEPSPPSTGSPTPSTDVFTVEATATGPTTVVIEWGDVPQATRFEIERSIAGESAWPEGEHVSAGKQTVIVGDLQPGTTYVFRVTAFLAQGDPVEATDVVTTHP